MLFKFVFRAALVAGALYATKKVLDRTGATEKIVEFGSKAIDVAHATALTAVGQVVDVVDDLLYKLVGADDESESKPEEAMTTPQAAQWAAANAGTGATAPAGGAGGKW